MNIKQIIPFLDENKKDIKVHCGIGTKKLNEPVEVFMKGEFEEWQGHQTKKNFGRKNITVISLYVQR